MSNGPAHSWQPTTEVCFRSKHWDLLNKASSTKTLHIFRIWPITVDWGTPHIRNPHALSNFSTLFLTLLLGFYYSSGLQNVSPICSKSRLPTLIILSYISIAPFTVNKVFSHLSSHVFITHTWEAGGSTSIRNEVTDIRLVQKKLPQDPIASKRPIRDSNIFLFSNTVFVPLDNSCLYQQITPFLSLSTAVTPHYLINICIYITTSTIAIKEHNAFYFNWTRLLLCIQTVLSQMVVSIILHIITIPYALASLEKFLADLLDNTKIIILWCPRH